MPGKDLFFILVLLAALALAAWCWLLDRRLERSKKLLVERERQLQSALEQLQLCQNAMTTKTRTGSEEFAVNLAQADMKQRLKGGGAPKDVPEKYRLVAAMARVGLNAETIAEILEMAPGEAQQLLKLARMSDTES